MQRCPLGVVDGPHRPFRGLVVPQFIVAARSWEFDPVQLYVAPGSGHVPSDVSRDPSAMTGIDIYKAIDFIVIRGGSLVMRVFAIVQIGDLTVAKAGLPGHPHFWQIIDLIAAE